MAKISDVISSVSTSIMANKNIDQFIHPRYIMNKLLDATYIYIKQKSNYKKLFQTSSLVEYLDCEELSMSSDSNCCGIKSVLRTKRPIETLKILNGDGIISVTSPDDSIEFTRSYSFKDVANKQKIRFAKSGKKYLVDDSGHIVIFGATPKVINIMRLRDPLEVINKLTNREGCGSIYDEDFPCPDDILPYVKQDAERMIASSLIFRIGEDENPNENKNIVN